ncbi:hypothetical protein [Amycolatopsis plumensis]|uniref:hypothetical protein n=1 Tax=Amycolatopsis plumensis TaxID=236508 RepID=UPI0036180688
MTPPRTEPGHSSSPRARVITSSSLSGLAGWTSLRPAAEFDPKADQEHRKLIEQPAGRDTRWAAPGAVGPHLDHGSL